MSLICGIAKFCNINTTYSTMGLNNTSMCVPFPFLETPMFPAYQSFKIETPNYYELFRNSFTPQNVFGRDYAQDFRQRTVGSGSKFQYTASSQQIMRNAGQYFHKKGTYRPQRGDIAIWTKAGDPAHGHVGIVTKIEGDNVWITEGNCGNAVKTVKYSLSKLMKNTGSRPFNGFVDAHSWLGSDVALKAAQIAETEQAKGVKETSNNDSVDIARYKRGAHNSQQWCAYFTSYCFTDGQKLNALG